MRTLFSLRVVLIFSCLLGFFPYTVKLNPPKITFKKYLLAYSIVYISITTTCAAYILSTILSVLFQSRFTVKNITTFFQMMAVVYPVFLYLYSIPRIGKLKDIVQRVLHSRTCLDNSLLKTLDWLSLVWLIVTCVECVYACIVDMIMTHTQYYVPVVVVSDLLVLPVFSQPTVLYHALMRLITLYLKATFAPLDEAILLETAVFLVSRKADSHSCKSTEEVQHSPDSASAIERLRWVQLGLCDLDQLLRDMNDHFGPLLCICLLSDQLLGIVFLQDVISNRNYSIFLSFVIVLLALMRIFLVMNTPGMFIRERGKWQNKIHSLKLKSTSVPLKEKLNEIEDDLAKCPKFEVCGLFEIGRQCLLPMLTFTLSYLLLMAQFVISEK